MRRILIMLAIIFTIGLTSAYQARSEPLIADLDRHLVAITTDFTGRDLLMFGSVDLADGDPGDVVIVVYGPNEEVVVRRKDRVAGMWLNTESMNFAHVPAFYHVAATSGSDLDLSSSIRARHQIGVENLRVRGPDDVDPDVVSVFRDALIRNKVRMGHYTDVVGVVERRGRLFRTTVSFPANVPVGTYTVETLLINDGRIVGAQTTPLFVSKVGVGAQVFRFAHTEPAAFGIAAILIAVFAGLGANWVFRKL